MALNRCFMLELFVVTFVNQSSKLSLENSKCLEHWNLKNKFHLFTKLNTKLNASKSFVILSLFVFQYPNISYLCLFCNPPQSSWILLMSWVSQQFRIIKRIEYCFPFTTLNYPQKGYSTFFSSTLFVVIPSANKKKQTFSLFPVCPI